MSTISCTICHGQVEQQMVKHDVPIYRCLNCQHSFVDIRDQRSHVSSVYSDDYFFGGKDGYPNYLEERSILVQRGRRYARRLSSIATPGNCLDVGAAAGFFLQGFVESGWSGVGLEPNESMVAYGRDVLGLEMIQGTLEELDSDRSFDLVTLIQVIGHLNNLRKSLDTLRSVTNRRALVLIESWNQESITAKLFGEYWHEYSPPSVVNWFTPARLDSLMQEFGFEFVDRGRTLKWISLNHALSLAKHVTVGARSSKPRQWFPSSWKLPYPSEDLFWAVYRKGH